jgi:hypothetical protein
MAFNPAIPPVHLQSSCSFAKLLLFCSELTSEKAADVSECFSPVRVNMDCKTKKY